MPNKKHSKKAAHRTPVSKRSIRLRRPVHKKLLLHPLTLFGLLCVGVFLTGLTWRSFALSYSVTATVPAPLLTQPAIITVPKANTVITSSPITVIGTCPANSYVTLTRNGLFSGVGICTGGAFSITTDLFPGLNQLQPQDYNLTDTAGPVSPIVDVTYTPSSQTKPLSLPLLDSAFRYQVFYVGQTIQWTINVSNGLQPYSGTVSWGDGSSSTISIGNASSFVISHVYFLTGTQIITITASDARGGSAQLQLAAVIKNKSSLASAIASNTTGPGTPLNGIQQWLWLIWPVYGTILLMALSFWLGEYQEYTKLRSRNVAAQRR